MQDHDGVLYPLTQDERRKLYRLRLAEEALREDGGAAWEKSVRALDEYEAGLRSRYDDPE